MTWTECWPNVRLRSHASPSFVSPSHASASTSQPAGARVIYPVDPDDDPNVLSIVMGAASTTERPGSSQMQGRGKNWAKNQKKKKKKRGGGADYGDEDNSMYDGRSGQTWFYN